MLNIPTDIGRSLNKDISALCPFSIGKNRSQNHCAHYVSHIMSYELTGPTCKNFTSSFGYRLINVVQSQYCQHNKLILF